MAKGKELINIPRALFEDIKVSTDRADYIARYMNDEGKEVPHELIQRYGYFSIPKSILIEEKKGNIFLADLTFLFACYYVAATSKRKNIRMDEVFECITRNWDEFRTRNAAERHAFTLADIDSYKRWIKKYEHNNKFYVKY